MPPSSKTAEPRWWQGHSPSAVAVIVLIVFVSTVPTFAGYVLEPTGSHFTVASRNAEDVAQHETWASEMAAHLRYQNSLTPEPTPRGWFLSPLEVGFGLIQRATGIPYMALWAGLKLACAPAMAFALMHLARGAGLSLPGAAAVIALLAGSFAPLVHGAAMLGLMHRSVATVIGVGGTATPTVGGGTSPYLLPALLVLVALPLGAAKDSGRGFRLAGVALSVMAMLYPFFVPTLWLTAILCALLWARCRGWQSMLNGIGWLCILPGLPMIYWAVLPYVDDEYARFAAANRQDLFSIPVTLVSLGLGVGAIVGIPRLLRANARQ